MTVNRQFFGFVIWR